MAKFNTITPDQLMRKIGTPDLPRIIDVRVPEDVAAHPFLIPTAVQLTHDAAAALKGDERPVVVVCHKGKKLSHGVAALLRDRGQSAEVLEGGFVAWADAALPSLPLAALPTTRPSRWVTRQRPKIDRIACPWLIRRFIDPDAQIMFAPPAEVLDVADRFDATAFDVTDAPFTHHGDRCSFDAMVAAFGLSHRALDTLADVVRAADLGNHDGVPQAAGLLAVSVGLSRMHRDDTAQLNAAMPIYDALYRWARDGQDETHGWPEGHSA